MVNLTASALGVDAPTKHKKEKSSGDSSTGLPAQKMIFGGHVEFKNVTISTPKIGECPSRELLRSVSFRIPMGESALIVGPSGT